MSWHVIGFQRDTLRRETVWVAPRDSPSPET
jgi:hypothetical protein